MLWIPASIIAGRGHVSDARRFLTALGPASEFACAARAVPPGVMAVAWIFEDRDRDQRRSVVHRTTLRFSYIIVSRLFAYRDGETALQMNRTPDSGKGLWYRMPLNFPNQSRSYDARQRCVRFWAYDEALEIPFFVEADALCHIDPKATKDEPGLLNVFDVHRGRICKAADRVYSRRRRGSYTLAVSDMK